MAVFHSKQNSIAAESKTFNERASDNPESSQKRKKHGNIFFNTALVAVSVGAIISIIRIEKKLSPKAVQMPFIVGKSIVSSPYHAPEADFGNGLSPRHILMMNMVIKDDQDIQTRYTSQFIPRISHDANASIAAIVGKEMEFNAHHSFTFLTKIACRLSMSEIPRYSMNIGTEHTTYHNSNGVVEINISLDGRNIPITLDRREISAINRIGQAEFTGVQIAGGVLYAEGKYIALLKSHIRNGAYDKENGMARFRKDLKMVLIKCNSSLNSIRKQTEKEIIEEKPKYRLRSEKRHIHGADKR